MMNPETEALIKEQFEWKTQTGEILTLPEMETSHIFNCFKMAFNHVAFHYNGTPIRFTKQWGTYHRIAQEDPKQLAWLTWVFHTVLEQRDDMNFADKWSYKKIMDQIYDNSDFKNDLQKPPETTSRLHHDSRKALEGHFDHTVGMSNGNNWPEDPMNPNGSGFFGMCNDEIDDYYN